MSMLLNHFKHVLRMTENRGAPPFVRVLPLIVFSFLTVVLSVWQIIQVFCLFLEKGFSIPIRVLALVLATAVSIYNLHSPLIAFGAANNTKSLVSVTITISHASILFYLHRGDRFSYFQRKLLRSKIAWILLLLVVVFESVWNALFQTGPQPLCTMISQQGMALPSGITCEVYELSNTICGVLW